MSALDDSARLDRLAYDLDRRAGEAFSATAVARTEPALLALCAQVDHMEADAAAVRRAAAMTGKLAALRDSAPALRALAGLADDLDTSEGDDLAAALDALAAALEGA